MTRYVCLLRAVNVAGKKVVMKDLAALFADLGHTDVVTYIQSGNVVFTSPSEQPSELARTIEERLEADLGQTAAVLLRSAEELDRIAAQNPFLEDGPDTSKLHVTFLASAPDPDRVQALGPGVVGPDSFRVLGREVFLHCPEGYGRSTLINSFWERRLKVAATTRNWNTVLKLLELARS